MLENVSYSHFFGEEFFRAERKKIFTKTWVYGCSWVEINKPGLYRNINTPFGQVIATSDGEKPHAFYNKCLHRGHELMDTLRSDGQLICPYHGWQYDSDGKLLAPGVLANIPGDKKFYEVERSLYQNLALEKVHALRIGDFVFLNASQSPLAIENQFDERVLASLERTRNKIGNTFLEFSLELEFNWKLIFENLRDGLHPLYLHRETLNKEVDFGFMKNYQRKRHKINSLVDLSQFGRDGHVQEEANQHKKNFELIDDKDMYLNWLLFPYTHIASPDGGALVGVENYVPISPTKTRLDLNLFITKSLGRASPMPILHNWFEKALPVFKEDFDALLSVQRNVETGNAGQHLGAYENKNLAIHQWFEDQIYV